MKLEIISIGFALLILSAFVAAPASAETYDIDENHTLDCNEFAETGSTAHDVTVPDSRISLHDKVEDGGIGNDYFRIEYNESIEHTIRVYIPSECFGPYTDTEVEPVDGGPNAQYEVIGDREYLAITVTLNQKGTYTYPLAKERSSGFWVFDRLKDKSPSDESDDPESQWSYVQTNELDGYGEKTIKAENPEEVSVQQKKNDNWVAVGDRGDYDKVFVETDNKSLTIVSTVEDAPEVRYNRNPSLSDSGVGAIEDAKNAVEEIRQNIKSTLDKLFE